MKAGPGSALALRLCGLSKSFGDVKAVDGLSLDVTRSEIFGGLAHQRSRGPVVLSPSASSPPLTAVALCSFA
jgi:hypothetical protein